MINLLNKIRSRISGEKYKRIELLQKLEAILGELPKEFETKPIKYLESVYKLASVEMLEIREGKVFPLKISDPMTVMTFLKDSARVFFNYELGES